ncbi:hypothetical protein ACFYN0_02985 [Streptomyces sp. NPDC006704]|uniref:hypothetical protein n=1 Tax=Streptomyces sp. NPDC006704 TaxID=3364760 RepID=UPI00369AF7DC
MDAIDLGFETTITPRRVETHTTLGWVAAITGLDDTYEYRRTFLGRVTPEDRDTPPRGWNAWRIPGPGLYEYRHLGNCQLSGFFVVGVTAPSVAPHQRGRPPSAWEKRAEPRPARPGPRPPGDPSALMT